MRKVGHLVGRNDGIDDRRAVNVEGFDDLGVQLAGLRGRETMAAASTGERRKIRIGKFDAFLVRGQTSLGQKIEAEKRDGELSVRRSLIVGGPWPEW